MFKGTPGIENIVAATNMQGSTGESERPEYLRVGREKSGFQDLESSVSQDWQSLYQWAIDNVMQNPTEDNLQNVYSRLEENCPDEVEIRKSSGEPGLKSLAIRSIICGWSAFGRWNRVYRQMSP